MRGRSISTMIQSKKQLEFQKDPVNVEGVLRMKFKISKFTDGSGNSSNNNLNFETNRDQTFGILNQSYQVNPKDDIFDMYDQIDSPVHIKSLQPDS